MSPDRALIKSAAIALFDAVGEMLPLGHQASKARRYVIAAPGAAPIELMFEQDAKSPPNVWITAETAGPLIGGTIQQAPSPASMLWTKTGKGGARLYGRHSALEKMSELGEADLIRLTPANLAQLGAILDQVLAASIARAATRL